MAFVYINKSDLTINRVALNDEDKNKILSHIDMEAHNEVEIAEADCIGFLNNTKKVVNVTATSISLEDWDGTSVDGNQIELSLEQVKAIAAQDLKNLKDYLGSMANDNHHFFPRIWEYVNYLESVNLEEISYPINDWYVYLNSIGQSFIRTLQLP